jgi:hypothetical protein
VRTFIEGDSVRLCSPCNEKNEEFERGDWEVKMDPVLKNRQKVQKKKKVIKRPS